MEVKNYKFKDRTELKTAVNLWTTNKIDAINTYGNIGNWDVSAVTDMSELFYNARKFNENIREWDVSQVTNMQGMFSGAIAFNNGESGNNSVNPLTWNVSQVTNMHGMFYNAAAFNQDIEKWNVSQVTTMQGMFCNTATFNQDIGQWNVSQVTNMFGMFWNATAFNKNINTKVVNKGLQNEYIAWNVSQVTTMQYMFAGAVAFNNGESGNNSVNPLTWNVSQVTTMYQMFYNATAFNQDISGWNVSQVRDLRKMFKNASAFNQDIGRWPILAVLDMFTNSGVSKETFLKHPNGTGNGVYGVAIGNYFDLPEPYVSYDRLLQSIIDKKNLANAGVIELLYKDLDDEKVKNKLEVDNKIRTFGQLGKEMRSFLGGSRYRITYTE